MLSPGEMAAVKAALDAATRAVQETERAYRDSKNWLAWVGVEDAETVRYRESWEVQRGLLDALLDKRNELIESGTPDHEAVLALVEIANRLARRDQAGAIRAAAESHSIPHATAAVVAGTAAAAAGAVERTLRVVAGTPWWAWPLGAGVVLALARPDVRGWIAAEARRRRGKR